MDPSGRQGRLKKRQRLITLPLSFLKSNNFLRLTLFYDFFFLVSGGAFSIYAYGELFMPTAVSATITAAVSTAMSVCMAITTTVSTTVSMSFSSAGGMTDRHMVVLAFVMP
jgi:hypothetical protein